MMSHIDIKETEKLMGVTIAMLRHHLASSQEVLDLKTGCTEAGVGETRQDTERRRWEVWLDVLKRGQESCRDA